MKKKLKSGMTLAEIVVVFAVISILLSSGCGILFSCFKDAVFFSTVNDVVNALSENRNQTMINPSASSSVTVDIPTSVQVSGLGNIYFQPRSGLPESSSSVFLSDGINTATITINREGGISF